MRRQQVMTIFKREMKSYFSSPVAYVFLVAFLVLLGFLTFSVSMFYERREADLNWFFIWHPWVYLLLVPAATMGIWAEERRTGTIELLLTLPVTLAEVLVGKFLAAWSFIALALVLTFPIVLTTAWLGDPDFGVIACGYIGSFLLAGACVSIGTLMSALTTNQVVSFVLALAACLLLILAGFEPVTNLFVRWAPMGVVEAVAECSLLQHYESLKRGVLDLYDIAYYIGVMIFMLATAHVVVNNRKAV
ncbi:MAG: ABC transporter permease subunit [Lentisphaerae bacterium]|jgi:ABC-2 type transport system permease protein|nr:ABC transporter permease subunit [Lentisphaerota bacterium]